MTPLPQDYHEKFLSVISGKFIPKGSSKKINLIFDDRVTEVELRNINSQERLGDTLQIRYDGNKELINHFKNIFKISYQHILNKENDNGKVIVPDDIAEYIEFYKIEQQPDAYRLKLITKESNSDTKVKFFNYIGDADKLINRMYQKSYKLLLLLELINNLDQEGKASYEKVCEGIWSFYKERHNKGLLAEQNDSKIQSQIDHLTIGIVKSVITENAYKVISEKGYLQKSEENGIEYVSFNNELWSELLEEDLDKLKKILRAKIDIYYETRVNAAVSYNNSNILHNYFKQIMSNYIDARTGETFAGHKLGNIFRKEIPEYLNKLNFIQEDRYTITGSIGQGNWAKIPWIALMNKASTTSTQTGLYVVYLFSIDMKKLYLTLNQGVTEFTNKFGRVGAKQKLISNAQKIREAIKMEKAVADHVIRLEGGSLGEMYEVGTIGAIEYDFSSIPNDDKLISDLEKLITYYENYLYDDIVEEENIEMIEHPPKEYISHIHRYISSKGYNYSLEMIKNYYLALKSKPFVLLAGISGTGKSKLVELFAESIGATSENGRYNLIPVRPDWSDPSDLLGYRNIEGIFQPGPLTTIIKRAKDNLDLPYFICLDEMNLARVEYYFSDILSIIETRKYKNNIIITDRIFKDEMFGNDDISRERYAQLYIPENLYIIGTVNMDETTFPFSKKVLDRANTIEFNEVNLNIDFDSIMEYLEGLEPLSIPNSAIHSRYIKLFDCISNREHIEEVIYVLDQINNKLEKIGLQFGYRIRDEIIFYTMYAVNEGLMSIEEALDYTIKQKILPRIQGSNFSIKEVLIDLFIFFIDEFSRLYDPLDNDNWTKMNKYINENTVKYPQCADKVCKMIRRYDVDGFTTFWE